MSVVQMREFNMPATARLIKMHGFLEIYEDVIGQAVYVQYGGNMDATMERVGEMFDGANGEGTWNALREKDPIKEVGHPNYLWMAVYTDKDFWKAVMI